MRQRTRRWKPCPPQGEDFSPLAIPYIYNKSAQINLFVQADAGLVNKFLQSNSLTKWLEAESMPPVVGNGFAAVVIAAADHRDVQPDKTDANFDPNYDYKKVPTAFKEFFVGLRVKEKTNPNNKGYLYLYPVKDNGVWTMIDHELYALATSTGKINLTIQGDDLEKMLFEKVDMDTVNDKPFLKNASVTVDVPKYKAHLNMGKGDLFNANLLIGKTEALYDDPNPPYSFGFFDNGKSLTTTQGYVYGRSYDEGKYGDKWFLPPNPGFFSAVLQMGKQKQVFLAGTWPGDLIDQIYSQDFKPQSWMLAGWTHLVIYPPVY